jgi:hypothetical protein
LQDQLELPDQRFWKLPAGTTGCAPLIRLAALAGRAGAGAGCEAGGAGCGASVAAASRRSGCEVRAGAGACFGAGRFATGACWAGRVRVDCAAGGCSEPKPNTRFTEDVARSTESDEIKLLKKLPEAAPDDGP